MPRAATAFAPASVANVAVGFDVLGHSVDVLGDRVHVQMVRERRVRISAIEGVVSDLPDSPERNSASAAVLALMDQLGFESGFDLVIEKGIPRGSGLGGSAASAVAGVVAAAGVLDHRPDDLLLLKCALQGERAACGTAHIDNVSASLYGGLVLTVGLDDPYVVRIPVPASIRCVLVRPRMELDTRLARRILKDSVRLADVVWQQANLGGFIAGCYRNDLHLIRSSLQDVMIEPQRKTLIPGFDGVKQAALENGALGCSISGGGPTVFAWCEVEGAARVAAAMTRAFRGAGLDTDYWITPVASPGARSV